MTEQPILLAYLILGNDIRQTCVHCSTLLARKGMLRKVSDHVMGHDVRVAGYQLVDPYTLADCRAAVGSEHKGGRPWPD